MLSAWFGNSHLSKMLEVLFHDEHCIAVHKPPRLLVHRTPISQDTDFLVQRLRDQVGGRVHPIHRLDRATAGVILFGLNSEAARELGKVFQERRVEKTYLAILRGFVAEEGIIEKPLAKNGDGPLQEAVTRYRRLGTAELEIPVSRYSTARYSLVEVKPETGRMHQIRRHFNHLRHPILGDRKHGPRHHNQMWREKFQSEMLMLLARKLEFEHPFTGNKLVIETKPEPEMLKMMKVLRFDESEFIPS